MRTVFDNHHSSAHITWNIRNFILYLDFLKLLLCVLHCLVKIRIEISHNRFPLYASIRNTVKNNKVKNVELGISKNPQKASGRNPQKASARG